LDNPLKKQKIPYSFSQQSLLFFSSLPYSYFLIPASFRIFFSNPLPIS
jgi:hypothetical protein